MAEKEAAALVTEDPYPCSTMGCRRHGSYGYFKTRYCDRHVPRTYLQPDFNGTDTKPGPLIAMPGAKPPARPAQVAPTQNAPQPKPGRVKSADPNQGGFGF